MPLGDMYDDDDSVHEAPPRQSLLLNLPDDVDNGTVQSLEFGRRALSEDPRMMGRLSGRFSDMNELEMDGEEYEVDGAFVNRRRTMNQDDLLDQIIEEGLDDVTAEMLTGQRGGRPSDANLGVFGETDDENEEPTFRFNIPPRMQVPAEEEAVEEEEEEREGTTNIAYETIYEDDEAEEAQAGVEIEQGEETAAVAIDNDDNANGYHITEWESEPELDEDADVQVYREEASAIDRSLQTQTPERTATQKPTGRQRKALNISRFGHEYPSFPAATVKKLAMGFAKSQGSKTKISKDTLDALVQSSDFFFEQIGEDLAAYAQHGGRKMIEESDVIALMKRYVESTYGIKIPDILLYSAN
jgi:histone H3/H4